MKLDLHDPGADDKLFISPKANTVIEVRLSERNLLSFLSKLYEEDSARTMYNTVVYVDGKLSDTMVLKLVAEKDEEHYKDPDRQGSPAGQVTPSTDSLIGKVREVLKEYGDTSKEV